MKMRKRRDKWNDAFELVLYVLAGVCLVYFVLQGNMAKIFEAVLIVAVLIIIKVVVKYTKTELFPALRFSILFFIFVTMFLANEFGLYDWIPYLDKIEHLFSGVILCFLGLLIFTQLNKEEEVRRLHAPTAVWFSLFFAVAMAGCWEIWEFTSDWLFGLHSQRGSLVDTMTDIICGTIAAAATSVYLAYKAKRQKLPLIDVG
jgi:uncharacterized membrane protein HdeD (DUF308 family)